MVLTSVAAACDAALRGQSELLLLVQDFLLPLVILGPRFAHRRGGRRLLRLWLDAATRASVPLEEYTAPALCEALQLFGRAFLDRALLVFPLGSRVWTFVAHEAVKADARDVLALLQERMHRVDAPLAIALAAEAGNLELVLWLRRHRFKCPKRKAFASAAKWGSLELLAACGSFGRKPILPSDLRAAALHAAQQGHLHIIRWLRENRYPIVSYLRQAMVEAVLHDQFDVAEFLASHQAVIGGFPYSRCMYREKGLETMCSTGQVAKLRWLHDRHLLADRIDTKHFEIAKTEGQVAVLDFFEATLPEASQFYLKPFSALNAIRGSIDSAKWALARGLLEKSLGCVYAAASHGHIAFVRWYVAEVEDAGMKFFPSYTVVPTAAERGYIECVKFLVEKGWGEATPEAVVAAAKHGHQDLVEWLVDHCNEPISFGNAMSLAAAGGHLETVQWLNTKISPGDKTSYGLVIAAARGHWRVIRWLLQHTTPSTATIDAAMFEAVRGGRLRVVQLLPWTPHCDPEALAMVARNYGRMHVATWIETYRSHAVADDAKQA